MGKRGKKTAVDTESIEGCSSASASTFADLTGSIDVDEVDDRSALEIVIDALYEKRAATREKALGGMVELLQNYSTSCLEVEERQETVSTLLANCIRRGGATEQERAAYSLGLLYAVLGCSDDTHRIFQDRMDLLKKVCRAGKSAECRATGVGALSMGAFIATADNREALEVMEFLESIFCTDPEAKKIPDAGTRAAAVRGWALLLTSLPQDLVKRHGYCETRLANLSRLLHDNSVELREAAGEGIAVLFDAVQDPQSDEGNPGEEECSRTVGNEAFEAELEAIRERMGELAKNLGDSQRRSKKDRSTQKTAFRDVLGVLDGQGVSEVKVKLRHGDSLFVDNVCTVTQLNFVRRFLAGGFQDHLQNNPLLHEVFDFQPLHEAGARLSKTERRMFKSQNSAASRARQKHRGAERASAAHDRHALLGESW